LKAGVLTTIYGIRINSQRYGLTVKYRRIYERSKIVDLKWLAASFFITLPLVVIEKYKQKTLIK